MFIGWLQFAIFWFENVGLKFCRGGLNAGHLWRAMTMLRRVRLVSDDQEC